MDFIWVSNRGPGRVRSNYRLCVARIVHDGTDLMNAFKIAFRIF